MVYELYLNKAVKTKKKRMLGGAWQGPRSGGTCRTHKVAKRLERRSVTKASHAHVRGLQ